MINHINKQAYQNAVNKRLDQITVHSESERRAFIAALNHFYESGRLPKDTPASIQTQLASTIDDLYYNPTAWGIRRRQYASRLAYQNDVDEFRRIIKQEFKSKIEQLQHFNLPGQTQTKQSQHSPYWLDLLQDDLMDGPDTDMDPRELHQISNGAIKHLSHVMTYDHYINFDNDKRRLIAENAFTIRNFMEVQSMTLEQLQTINSEELQTLIQYAEQVETLNKHMVPKQNQYLKFFNQSKNVSVVPSNNSALPLSMILELPYQARDMLIKEPYNTRKKLDAIGATTDNLSQCEAANRQAILQNIDQAYELSQQHNINFNHLAQLPHDQLQQLLDTEIEAQSKADIIGNINSPGSPQH